MQDVLDLLKDLEYLVDPLTDGRIVLRQLSELYRSTQILSEELRRNGIVRDVLLYEPDGLAKAVVDEASFVEAVQALERLVKSRLCAPLVLGQSVPQQLGLDVLLHGAGAKKDNGDQGDAEGHGGGNM